MPTFTYIELFAGIGGFRVGLEALGGELVWGCDIDLAARITYRANFGQDQTLYNDITQAKSEFIPSHDILTGGFPCQDFSNLGAGFDSGQQGLDGKTGSLFYEVVRILRECQPKSFLLENVQGLLTMKEGQVFQHVIRTLKSVGYHVHYTSMNSNCLLPQFRRRVYIVGFLDAAASERFSFPVSPQLSPCRTVGDILACDDPFVETYRLSARQWRVVRDSKAAKKYGIATRILRPSSTEADTLLKSYRASKKSMAQFVYSEKQVDGRPRWLTTREVARLMGFPNHFIFPPGSSAYNQLGNAVTPPIIALIGGHIVAALFEDEQSQAIGLEVSCAIALEATAPALKQSFLRTTVSHPDFNGTVDSLIYGRQRRNILIVTAAGILCWGALALFKK
jgi:DNA (cytosine-5)-methyltransferase 1